MNDVELRSAAQTLCGKVHEAARQGEGYHNR
jgi:hypothetical protein